MLVVLLASIVSKNKLKRCWAELCRLVSVAGQGWATEKSVRPLFLVREDSKTVPDALILRNAVNFLFNAAYYVKQLAFSWRWTRLSN
jgi:hypothetical protein